MEKIIYIADLDQDVDDVIAAEYLHRKAVLAEVVCDPVPRTKEGFARKRALQEKGILVENHMPAVVEYVIVGGALTKVADYLVTHKIDHLAMNGGFVGSNIVKTPLKKFEGKRTVRTFNFNCDVNATDRVLKSKNIRSSILLVGKNVCHSRKNTMEGIWKDEKQLLEKYHARPDKRQHDMLACREALILWGMLNEPSYLTYKALYPYNTGLKGSMTQWGSRTEKSEYQLVLAATGWR